MVIGLDVALVTKALAPLVGTLCKEAGGAAAASLKKWNASTFPKKLAAKLVVADKIKTIWSADKETSLLSIYFPSKIKIGPDIKTIDSLSDLPGGNIVIEGIVGHGKSMFLRYLYLQELAGNGTGKLPIFIELRTLTEKRDLDTHFYDALRKMDIAVNDDIFDYLAQSGTLVVLLDGFDEVDENLVSSTIQKIEFLAEQYENLRIIITSRPSAEIQKSRLFKTFNLLGLQQEDYSGFLSKLGVHPEKSLEIREAIRKSPSDVSSLITTPLMMTLLVIVYESEKEIPSELPEFFEKLFFTMFTRHDRLKAGFSRKHYSGLSERKLQHLFEIFCFVSIRQRYGRSLSTEQFSDAFDRACKYSSSLSCDTENFRKDIVKVACLMVEEGFDLITFLHKSIAEYFSAAFIWRSNDDFAEKFYAGALTRYENWGAVLTFLEKIDTYRYAKYYTLLSFERLFETIPSINSVDTPVDDWLKFFIETEPNFGITFVKHGSGISEDFVPSEYGPYRDVAPFGGQLHNEIVHRVMEGINAVLPSNISEEELIEKNTLFSKKETKTGRIEYRILLKPAIDEYGKDGLIIALNQFKLDILRRYEAAKLVVKRENDKDDMVDDMP